MVGQKWKLSLRECWMPDENDKLREEMVNGRLEMEIN